MTEEMCDVCDSGIGHPVWIDPDDPPMCKRLCIVCRKQLSIDSQEDVECCDHRYVGEDLYQADKYYGLHDDNSENEI